VSGEESVPNTQGGECTEYVEKTRTECGAKCGGEPNAISRVLMWQDQRGRDPC